LTEERVKALEELGFVWTLKTARSSSSPSNKKKAPKKRPKHSNADPGQPSNDTIKSKKSNNTSSSNNNANIVSTKLLPNGSQIIGSNETITHCDGSTVEMATEETIHKRTIRQADGTRILETTTRIVTTKVERIVIPSSLPLGTTMERMNAAKKKEGKEESIQSSSKSSHEELLQQLPPLVEVPLPAAATTAAVAVMLSEPITTTTLESPKESTSAMMKMKVVDPTDSAMVSVAVAMMSEPTTTKTLESPKESTTAMMNMEVDATMDSSSPSNNDVEERSVIVTLAV